MGGGSYSSASRLVRADAMGYSRKSVGEIFTQRNINNAMNPKGVALRESRDSDEHPNSLAIVLALDVTGSMGTVPHYLVKEGLPHMMDKIIEAGIPDPQVLFVGIGDHVWDSAPLQIGQFESSDELLDKWLTDIYLEGGGGGNEGESYSLAWYFAGNHTEIDCHEKRSQKGLLFTVGDEPVLKKYPTDVIRKIMGEGQTTGGSHLQLLQKAQEKYDVYHLNIHETASGGRPEVESSWKKVLGDNFVQVPRKEEVAEIIARTVVANAGVAASSTSGDAPSPTSLL